jgi:inosine/xanthosine triphosphatase
MSLDRLRLVAVGSTNPVKVAAARVVLARVAPGAEVRGVAVPSGVPDQPWGDEETIRGAAERARAALRALAGDALPDGAALGVGFEGGVVAQPDGGVRSCAWAAVAAPDGTLGVGGSLAMPLPPPVARLLREGVELGHAVDRLTGATNTKHAGGAVAALTRGLVDRQRAYEVILAYALARFLTPELWDG